MSKSGVGVHVGLVFAQMATIALMFFVAGSQIVSGGASPLPVVWLLAVLLVGVAGWLGVWALVTMDRHTFSVMPKPKEGGQLCRQGPYRWIRHPMYGAVLLFCLACAMVYPAWYMWFMFALLVCVLFVKSSVEESLLADKYPEYSSYRSETRRFL